jgi:microcompartment protein CcmK/EutM
MMVARVIGTVVASRKDPALGASALLLVQPLATDGKPTGKPVVAVDSVGCGVGEQVFYVRGREAALPFLPAEVPTDAAIVGIVDHWNLR